MLDVSPVIATLIMFGSLLLLLFMGLPVLFALGGVGIMSVLLLWGPEGFPIAATNTWALMNFYTLVAVAFFIFMAMLLQASGVADDLFRSMRLWFGAVPGGLAMGVVFVCTIIAAMSGVSATGVVTMGILALPLMLKVNYNKAIAIGPILAGGALGFLIPPSVSFIMYGCLAKVSIGKLFLGGVIPGLILSILYVSYIGIRCHFQRGLGPPLPPEERVGWKEKILSLRAIFLPALLIMGVLGTIFMGIASPTEAASVGAFGAVACAAIHRRLSWQMIREAGYGTFRITCMIMWIMVGAFCFKATFISLGGPALASEFVGGLTISPVFVILVMQVTYVFLGCFLDEFSIMFITLPAYLPIVTSLGYDPVWFGVLFLVNMQMAYLTPPFGGCLFYMKGVAPPEISMGDIYRSILPFIPLQMTCVLLVLFFPQLALWLPNLVFGLK